MISTWLPFRRKKYGARFHSHIVSAEPNQGLKTQLYVCLWVPLYAASNTINKNGETLVKPLQPIMEESFHI